MKKIIKYIFMIIVLAVFSLVVVKNHQKGISTVRAFGDLFVDFHVAPTLPIFTVTDFLPNSPAEERDVDVNNAGSVAKYVAVKAVKTGPAGQDDPQLEEALHFVVKSGTDTFYDGSLKDFFDSYGYSDPNENGLPLDILNPSDNKTYTFSVTFPPTNDDNPYQNKSVVFDLVFGVLTADHIVINEVFYDVDSAHGIDSWKDRGSPKNDKKKGNDDEWIELYNPTSEDINIKNWTLEDASGKKVTFHANKIIKSGDFALVSKDASMWRYWSENDSALKIVSTDFLGDGLDDNGDHLILRDSGGIEVDFVRWEADNFSTGHWVEDPTDPSANIGASIERIVPGFDNDLSSDWIDNLTHIPTP